MTANYIKSPVHNENKILLKVCVKAGRWGTTPFTFQKQSVISGSSGP